MQIWMNEALYFGESHTSSDALTYTVHVFFSTTLSISHIYRSGSGLLHPHQYHFMEVFTCETYHKNTFSDNHKTCCFQTVVSNVKYHRISNNSYTPFFGKRWYSNLFVHIKMKLLFYCSYSNCWCPVMWVNMLFWLLVSIVQPGTPWRRNSLGFPSDTLHIVMRN